MFNQRPTSLLGLEPRHDGGELLNFLSPMISTPVDDYIKYFDYFLSRERLTDPSLPATTPNSLGPTTSTINHFHQQQQQIHHQQPQQQQQLHHQQQQVQQLVHQHQIPHQPSSHLPEQLQYQQQSQLPHLPIQHEQQKQNQQLIEPQIQEAPNPDQTFEGSKIPKQEFGPVITVQQAHQAPVQQFQPPIIKHDQQQVELSNNVQDRSKLTEEEKIRNKRERNRRAAANCRRRKDEKLRKLADENMELRKTIESLQNVVASLQTQIASSRND